MYQKETLEATEAEVALDATVAEAETSLTVRTQPQATTTLNPSRNMPVTLQVPPPIWPSTTKIKTTKRSTRRPPLSQATNITPPSSTQTPFRNTAFTVFPATKHSDEVYRYFKKVVDVNMIKKTASVLRFEGMNKGTFWEALFTFLYVDILDTTGTLYSMARFVGFLDLNSYFEGQYFTFMADASSIVMGSLLGTSPVTAFIESSTVICKGRWTGLTALTVVGRASRSSSSSSTPMASRSSIAVRRLRPPAIAPWRHLRRPTVAPFSLGILANMISHSPPTLYLYLHYLAPFEVVASFPFTHCLGKINGNVHLPFHSFGN
ncbi:hypothetical protein HN51_005424 [Arachis hypogaea]